MSSEDALALCRQTGLSSALCQTSLCDFDSIQVRAFCESLKTLGQDLHSACEDPDSEPGFQNVDQCVSGYNEWRQQTVDCAGQCLAGYWVSCFSAAATALRSDPQLCEAMEFELSSIPACAPFMSSACETLITVEDTDAPH